MLYYLKMLPNLIVSGYGAGNCGQDDERFLSDDFIFNAVADEVIVLLKPNSQL